MGAKRILEHNQPLPFGGQTNQSYLGHQTIGGENLETPFITLFESTTKYRPSVILVQIY